MLMRRASQVKHSDTGVDKPSSPAAAAAPAKKAEPEKKVEPETKPSTPKEAPAPAPAKKVEAPKPAPKVEAPKPKGFQLSVVSSYFPWHRT